MLPKITWFLYPETFRLIQKVIVLDFFRTAYPKLVILLTVKKKLKRFKVLTPNIQKIWKSIVKNYELIEGAQLSNSFIILMILDKAEESLTSSFISKIISYNSLGRIYKPASTLKDSLENRLKREGYVEELI